MIAIGVFVIPNYIMMTERLSITSTSATIMRFPSLPSTRGLNGKSKDAG